MPADMSFADDLDVQLDPNEYQDPSLPLPIAGNFGVRIKKSDLKKVYGKDEIVYVDGKYPVLRFSEVEIATPDTHAGRAVYLPFVEFGTKPYMETDFNAGGVKLPANNLAKILRSHDATLGFRSLEEGLKTFEQLVNSGAVFHVQLDYIAEDRKWIGEQVKLITAMKERGSITEDDANAQMKDVRYKKGRKEGVRNFVVGGQVVPMFESPSGELIQARTTIKRWISTAQLGDAGYKLGLNKVLQPKA